MTVGPLTTTPPPAPSRAATSRRPGALAALVRATLRFLLGLCARRSYRDLDNLPATGAAIVASNHISLADPPVLYDAVTRTGRTPRALAAAGLFRAPLLGWAFHRLGFVPVERGTARAAAALDAAADALGEGELLLIYPEGGIPDGDGWPRAVKSGVVRLAMTTGAPVVPVAQWGAQRLWRPRTRGNWRRLLAAPLRRPRIVLLVGEPLTFTGDPEDRAAVAAANAILLDRITGLLRQARAAADGTPADLDVDLPAAA